jgi:hypothetical protein
MTYCVILAGILLLVGPEMPALARLIGAGLFVLGVGAWLMQRGREMYGRDKP